MTQLSRTVMAIIKSERYAEFRAKTFPLIVLLVAGIVWLEYRHVQISRENKAAILEVRDELLKTKTEFLDRNALQDRFDQLRDNVKKLEGKVDALTILINQNQTQKPSGDAIRDKR